MEDQLPQAAHPHRAGSLREIAAGLASRERSEVDRLQSFRVVSLFSGCGGMDLGFLCTGRFAIVFANDHMQAAVETYRNNIGPHIYSGSIEDIETFPHATVLIGGPPCQGFSSANPYRGVADSRNWLFREYLRALQQIRPAVFVMENVRGIRTLASGRFYADMKKEFEQANYRLSDRLLDAADFGVPQRRVRNILVGTRADLRAKYQFPSANTFPGIFGGLATAGDALLSHPLEPDAPNHDVTVSTELNRERLRHIPEGGSMVDCPIPLRTNSDPKRAMRRLHREQPSYTIVHNNCDHFYHPTEDRRITIREMARLQTFPDAFTFVGSKSEQSIQVANAVPVKMASAIALSVAAFLDSVETLDGTSREEIL